MSGQFLANVNIIKSKFTPAEDKSASEESENYETHDMLASPSNNTSAWLRNGSYEKKDLGYNRAVTGEHDKYTPSKVNSMQNFLEEGALLGRKHQKSEHGMDMMLLEHEK